MITRRSFLRGTVLVAGATVVGKTTGCAEDSVAAGTSDTAPTGDVDPGSDTAPGDTTEVQVVDGVAWFPQSIASGDPRPDGVILWARAVNPDNADEDVTVLLEVATDVDLVNRVTLAGALAASLTGSVDTDHCLKARLVGLEPDTTYYYRFLVESGGTRYASRTAQTRTAPLANADVPVRFAYVSCQDFNGRYYHSYARLLALDPAPDFVVHLGDYIYETTGDPSFQSATEDRKITLTDTAGALKFNGGTESEYFAAASLSNYRELFQQYRSDATLQAVHERWPMIVTWDDHEFSNDCWRENATYSDGHEAEVSPDRRRAASRAWSEHMPVDFPGEPDFVYDESKPIGEDIRIYRDFGWGKHLHVFLTDNRSYRADHLVPEGAYPGAMSVSEVDLASALGTAPDDMVAFVDIDTHDGGIFKAPLKATATAAEAFPDLVTGLISVQWINKVLADHRTAGEANVPEDIVATAEMSKGYAWFDTGKLGHTGSLGSRYFGIVERYNRLAKAKYKTSGGASEDMLGAAQEGWLKEGIASSDRTWKAWGTPFALATHTVDLRTKYTTIPEAYRHRWALLLEDWNGAPVKKDELVTALAKTPNTVAIAGDIHSFWSSLVIAEDGSRLVEFVGGAISSSTFQKLLISSANSDPGLKAAGAAALALLADTLLLDPDDKPNPGVGFVRSNLHGFAVAEVSAGEFAVTYHLTSDKTSLDPLDAADLDAAFSVERFKTTANTRDLWMEREGTWQRWDPDSFSWKAS